MSRDIKTRLLSKAVMQGTCLIYSGGKSKTSGYGLIWHDKRNQTAHRVSYRIHHGVIPNGMHVMHTCDNRLCINPEHLVLGTRSDNMIDKEAKGRGNHVFGTKHPKSRLTAKIAEQIHKRYIPYHRIHGSCAMAREFGVTQSTIHAVIRGVTWAQA